MTLKKNHTFRALRVHYGVRHKVVLDHLAQKLGLNKDTLKRQMKEGRRQAVEKRQGQQSSSGGASPVKQGGAQPTSALPPHKAIAEDKKFPKCRLCGYRYFSRIDLRRHLVDNHLRARLARVIPQGATTCPAPDCPKEFETRQTCVRHFVSSHQSLDRLVEEELGLKLSEFPPSIRDVELERNRSEKVSPSKSEFKEVADVAELPVKSAVDVKCKFPSCELCGEEFTTSVNKVRPTSSTVMYVRTLSILCQ